MHHIRNTLPEIKSKIAGGLAKYQNELVELGDPLGADEGNKSNQLLSVITEFTSDFRTVIEGNSNNFTTAKELSGGARIAFVFHEIFAHAIRYMDPFDEIKDVDIRTIVYNSSVSFSFSVRSLCRTRSKLTTMQITTGFLTSTFRRHSSL